MCSDTNAVFPVNSLAMAKLLIPLCVYIYIYMFAEGDEMEAVEMGSDGEPDVGDPQVYLPGQPLEEGEELVHDSSAYHMYHSVSCS